MPSYPVLESVQVVAYPGRAYPAEFTWRGRRHLVLEIEQFRTVSERRLQGVKNRKLFRLRTRNGLRCELSLEIEGDRWRIERILKN